MAEKLLFITGTRADWGKIKPLIQAVKGEFDYDIFATGMHTLSLYGETAIEIEKAGFKYYPFINQDANDSMDTVLSNTIQGLSYYIREHKPDMIVVHGDRVEALAGACVGALNNILVAHIEGGELSGTIDGIIRHAVSKLSHVHFTANEESAQRLFNMGESNVFVIGSPDIDVMMGRLPSLDEVRLKYSIDYQNYSIFCYHPVTSEISELERNISVVCQALLESGRNYIVIYPNNDTGTDIIMREINKLPFKKLPSMRFEYFLTLLQFADCIVGNSSAGIREAPVYGVPTVNIGTRQSGRSQAKSIINVSECGFEILKALDDMKPGTKSSQFGRGNSAKLFVEQLKKPETWAINTQKVFRDIIAP